MSIKLLDEMLPIELTDKIYYMLHRSIMRDISIILKHKIIFVLVGDRISFLVCESQNYYTVLDVF